MVASVADHSVAAVRTVGSRVIPGLTRNLCLFLLLILAGCATPRQFSQRVLPNPTDPSEYAGIRQEYLPLAALVEEDTGQKPVSGNSVELITEGRDKYDLLMSDVAAADSSIYIEHFRICADNYGSQIQDSLCSKANDGLDVRVLVDKKAHTPRNLKALRLMIDEDVQTELFFKPYYVANRIVSANQRDHRKIIVIDSRIGYIGGRNIQDKYFESWKDFDIRVTGPAVADMERTIALNWDSTASEPLPVHAPMEAVTDTIPGLQRFRDKVLQVYADAPTDTLYTSRDCYEWSLANAKCYFWIASPYVSPPKSTIEAIEDAARRGVDVRMMLQGPTDVALTHWITEHIYKRLLESGVKLYEWQGTILHAKYFVMDDYLVSVGSVNLDNMSFFLNYEDAVLIYDTQLAGECAKLFEKDMLNCREVRLEDVRRWSVFRRLRNWLFWTLGNRLA